MVLNEADTRAKLIDPKIHNVGWKEDLIRRETPAGTIEIINGRTKRKGGRTDYLLCLPVKDKETPFTLDKFDDFFKRLSSDKEKDKISDNSWFIDVDTIKNKNYDLKAVNPNIKEKVIPKPEELIKIIEESQIKINESLKKLKEIK